MCMYASRLRWLLSGIYTTLTNPTPRVLSEANVWFKCVQPGMNFAKPFHPLEPIKLSQVSFNAELPFPAQGRTA